MGTSASGNGASGNNALIPSWIPISDSPDDIPDRKPDEQPDDEVPSQDKPDNKSVPEKENGPLMPPLSTNRYRQPRVDFNKYLRGGDRDSLKRSIKGYGKNAGGSSSAMAKRMRPAVSRISSFYQAINTIRDDGKQAGLAKLSLSSYANRTLSETLSALSDQIFKDSGSLFDNIQDDSINRQAYANSIVRMCSLENINLDNLSNENVEIMIAIFIEETISQKVICDIGNNMTKIETDASKLVEIENNVYQIVSGMVRNQIMHEIIATQRGNQTNVEKQIENIYRVAFDALSDTQI